MKSTFLENILTHKRRRIAAAKALPSADGIRERAAIARSASEPNAFSSALSHASHVNIIAEIKRASPSKGVINDAIDVAELAKNYQAGGARAISVLTEEDFFQGSIEDLRTARAAVDVPILRKDFVVDEYQIFEAAQAGADAVLLIVAALSLAELSHLSCAVHETGMDALVEVHDRAELEIARDLGCKLIGVNNRSLHTFEVSLDVSRDLIKARPDGSLMIAESGISTLGQIDELRALGFDAFLIGETLMRNGDPRAVLEAWT